MPGLVPGIHVLSICQQEKTWMAGGHRKRREAIEETRFLAD
jgi:hypothetical protein